jgi:hypothetical protein
MTGKINPIGSAIGQRCLLHRLGIHLPGDKESPPQDAAQSSPLEKSPVAQANVCKRRTARLDAIALTLEEGDGPMKAGDLFRAVIAKGYWCSGNNPRASLQAAICRDIFLNGKQSRFRRIKRGVYELARRSRTA